MTFAQTIRLYRVSTNPQRIDIIKQQMAALQESRDQLARDIKSLTQLRKKTTIRHTHHIERPP